MAKPGKRAGAGGIFRGRFWRVLTAAGLVLAVWLAAGCAGKPRQITGLVTELRFEDGRLSAIFLQTQSGEPAAVLLTDETRAFPPEDGAWTADELRRAFEAAVSPDVQVTAACAGRGQTLTAGDGAQVAARPAQSIKITGRLDRGAAALADGTVLDVFVDTAFSSRSYRLPDGTELLCAKDPSGPANTYVGGVESLDALDEAARQQVLSFYEARGLLYNEQAELEKVYALYRQLGAEFCSGLADQAVSPSASSGRVLYLLTAVTLPTGSENGNRVYEERRCDAFDRATGARIDPWALFTLPREAVIQTLLDEAGVPAGPQRTGMETAAWDGRIVFLPDGLSVTFEPGTLPGQPEATGFSLGYTPAVRAVIQSWALPQTETT